MDSLSGSQIKENYLHILERIAVAAHASGRNPEDIRLVVVTKTHPIEVVEAVVGAGAQYLGENYAEEAVVKIKSLSSFDQVQWHMIGHVQSRKASLVCDYFDYLHSLDSLKLALRLNRLEEERNRVLPVLLEFNLGDEESKFGWSIWQEDNWQAILVDIAQVLELTHLNVKGLMGMAPYFDDGEKARPYYQRLHKFRELLLSSFPQGSWSELSMGMSGDFEVAIQEGATWVRIGQSILGPRNSN